MVTVGIISALMVVAVVGIVYLTFKISTRFAATTVASHYYLIKRDTFSAEVREALDNGTAAFMPILVSQYDTKYKHLRIVRGDEGEDK